MTKISLVQTTARESYGSMIGLEKTELFTPTIESLKKQSSMDFELIIVDALHHERPDRFTDNKLPFKIKHVPFTKKESRWLHRGMWNNVQQRNKGIIHSDGELVVFCPDCCMFSPESMEWYWWWHLKGYMPQAVFRYNRDGKPNRTETGMLDRDFRWNELDRAKKFLTHNNPSWCFEYTGFPIRLLLKVNGFDELFDGTQGLEDVEIGFRLAQLKINNYVLDKHLYAVENCHYTIPRRLFHADHEMKGELLMHHLRSPDTKLYASSFKCNYSILMFNEQHHRWRANTTKLSDEDIQEIKLYMEDCFSKGIITGAKYIWEKSRHYEYWKNLQPVFNLKELRDERVENE